jgi:hypothetical protein
MAPTAGWGVLISRSSVADDADDAGLVHLDSVDLEADCLGHDCVSAASWCAAARAWSSSLIARPSSTASAALES